jgi:UDP-glucose 4-epimerase
MRVLVTGAAGFTGRAVVHRLLADGHDVTALTSSPDSTNTAEGAELAHADLRDRATLTQVIDAGRFDGVCHLAALTRVRDSFANPVRYFDVNTTGTLNLLAALDAANSGTEQAPRLVFASTGAVYGARDGALNEDEHPAPANPYGASKWAAEQAIGYQAATGRLAAITLRCFNIAGAACGHGDTDLTRIIPKTLAVAAGQADRLQINGDGGAVREYTHVLDIASAFALALEATVPGRHQVLNVGSGQGVSLAEVVAAAHQITGREIPSEHLPPKPEAQVLMADSTRIRTELGWSPAHSSLEEILRDGWRVIAPVAA